MSDFPFNSSKKDTRKWLDNNGFAGYFTNWKADAIIGASNSYILSKFEDADEGERLLSLLNTARMTLRSKQVLIERKIVTLIYPSVTEKDEIIKCKVIFQDERDFQDYCRINNGRIRKWNEGEGLDYYLPYDDLLDGGVYAFGGEFFRAIVEDKQHRQIDAKVFEHESGLAVRAEVGLNSRLHENLIFEHNGKKRELDGIVVHKGGKDIANSTAYVIESQITPSITRIDKLMDKADLFRSYISTSDHFRSVTHVVPVLAGKKWNQEVIDNCARKNIWRVTPSGRSYKVIRAFHTLLKLKK